MTRKAAPIALILIHTHCAIDQIFEILFVLKGRPGSCQEYVNGIEEAIGDGPSPIWLALRLHFSVFENGAKMTF